MITFLQGIVQCVEGNVVTLHVGDIGFGISVVDPHYFIVGEKAQIHVRLVWHQEDGPQLYGFKSAQQRTIFDLVTTCSGFGPKIALAVLQTMQPFDFISAIISNNKKILSSVPGIGEKKAEIMILQLKTKVKKLLETDFPLEEQKSLMNFKELSSVLLSLGYSQKEIAHATSYVNQNLSGNYSFDEYVRKALTFLAKKI